MAASFAAASSQSIRNAGASVTAPPFTVGFWLNMPTSATTRVIFSLADTGVTNSYWIIFKSTSDVLTFGSSQTNGGSQNSAVATAISGNAWEFVIARAISTSNRRMSVLHATGLVEHVQGTTIVTPTGIDTIAFGGRITSAPDLPNEGLVGEFWCTNTDIQPDGAQLDGAMFRQLAYGGPFSVPHVAKDIIEYRSLRKYPSSEGDDVSEVYFGGAGRQTWTNTNGVTTGTHPSLPYWYVKPNQNQRALVI